LRYIGLSTASSGSISTIFVSSEKLVFNPSTGSIGIGTTVITNTLTVVGTATATDYYGSGATLVGIVTQIVAGIGVTLDPVNGKGRVQVYSYSPIGKTIYVSQNGNDSYTGLAENYPKRSIKSAAGIASSGDTIKVFPGVYVENNPIILEKSVSVEGAELRNCIVTPQNSGLDLFHVNNSCHVTDLSFVGPDSTNGASVIAFRPLSGVSSNRFFDGARMIRMNLDFIASETVGYLTSTDYRNPAFSIGVSTSDIKSVLKAVCFDITRGGNSKSVGAGKTYYTDAGVLQYIVGIKTETMDALTYAAGIARSCINNVSFTKPGGGNYRNYTQIKDLSMQSDGAYGNQSLSGCANVVSAIYSCVGVVTTIIRDGLGALGGAGINTTYPTAYDGLTNNNWSATKIGGNTYSPGVGPITQGPYIRNCTNFIPKSIGLKVNGFEAEPGDQDDIGVTGSMSLDSYTQYNQGGIGASITNGAYAQLVSLFTICDDIAVYTAGGGQCDITNSNASFGNYGLYSNGIGDASSRSIYRYSGIVTQTASQGTDTLIISGIASNRPYDGQAVYFDKLYYSILRIDVTNGGSGYTSVPIVTIDAPTGPSGIRAEGSANISGGKVTSIDIISSGSQYLTNPNIQITGGEGSNAAASPVLDPIYYGIESATLPNAGISTIVLTQNLNNTVSAGSTAYFSRLSLQLATSISLEWVGSGTNINTAKPALGGVSIQDNEVYKVNGGQVIYTSTNQSGNFQIGDDVIINQLTGTISGRAFSQSLLNTVTPLIIALGN